MNSEPRRWVAWVLPVALLVSWQLMSMGNAGPGTLWPSPLSVLGEIVQHPGLFLDNVVATMTAAMLGFLAGVVLAFVLSVAATRLGPVGDNLFRISLALYSLPLIALAPVLTIWFGIGLTTKVVVALLASFFPVMVNLSQALRSTDRGSMELMALLGAASWQRLFMVELPYALPALFAACKVAAPNAIIGAMLAEWVGSERGLGIMLLFAMFNFQVSRLWATLIVATTLTLSSYYLFDWMGRRLFPWHASEFQAGDVT